MTAKEIKNYIDMMKHTLNRRMDSQAGKEGLIKEYTEKMEEGLNAIEELEELKAYVKEYFRTPKAGEIYKNPLTQNAIYLNIMRLVGEE